MSPDSQAICYFVALVAFAVAAVLAATRRADVACLTALGLAFMALVPLWNAI